MSWTIKDQEKAKYDQIFDGLLPINGLLSGDKVKPILLNSKLPVAVLGTVWELSDIDKDGMLDRDEFSIAMHLVYKTLERTPLPQSLPPELVPPSKKNIPNMQPAMNKIVITASEKAHYDDLFSQYDCDKDGLVGGTDVKDVFLHTGLAQHTLAHIWNLSDLTASGKLNRDQFQLAMSLVQMKLQGHPLPPSISPEMLPSSIQLPTPDSMLAGGDPDDSGNKELDLIIEEINSLKDERMTLERELAQNEADMHLEQRETLNVQKELEGLLFSQKQLECRKVEAQKRSEELDEKKRKLQSSVSECKSQFERDQLKIQELRHKLSNTKPMSQEEETAKLRGEIERLGGEEVTVEARYLEGINSEKRLNERIKQLEGVLVQVNSSMDKWKEEQKASNEVTAFASEDAFKEDPFNNFDPFPKSQHDPFDGESLAEHFNEGLDGEGAGLKDSLDNNNTDPWGGGGVNLDAETNKDFGSFNEAPHNDSFQVDNLDPFGTGSFQPDFTNQSQLPTLPPKKKKSPAPPRPPAPKPHEDGLSAANLTAAKLLRQENKSKSKSMLEAEQLAWAKRDSEEEYERMRRMKEKEQQDLEMAIALSKQEMGGR